MNGERRFSQAISDGDRISLVASAPDDDSAHRAAADGATALVAGGPLGDHTLPVLWRGSGGPQAARCRSNQRYASVVWLMLRWARHSAKPHIKNAPSVFPSRR